MHSKLIKAIIIHFENPVTDITLSDLSSMYERLSSLVLLHCDKNTKEKFVTRIKFFILSYIKRNVKEIFNKKQFLQEIIKYMQHKEISL